MFADKCFLVPPSDVLGAPPFPQGEAAISRLLGAGWSGADELSRAGVSLPLPGARSAAAHAERVLLTLLFTDIVGSTEKAERLGDQAWSDLLTRHHSIVRDHLAAHRGTEIDTAGDGFFATFDRPSRAVCCAAAIRTALKTIDIDIRSGVHAGECEVAAGRVVGVSVHVAARVAQIAQAGEILISRTVRDLLAGSSLRFTDRERQPLKGLSESTRLFAVEC